MWILKIFLQNIYQPYNTVQNLCDLLKYEKNTKKISDSTLASPVKNQSCKDFMFVLEPVLIYKVKSNIKQFSTNDILKITTQIPVLPSP